MNLNANVLLIAFRFPPENTSGAVRPAYFHRYLPAYGYDSHVISRQYAAPGQQVASGVERVPDERLNAGKVRLASRACALAQRVLPYNDQLPWAPYAISAGMRKIANMQVQAIISTGPPLATHLVAMQLKRQTGIPWIADFQDPLMGNPFRQRPLAVLYDGMIERTLFKHADGLIANTDSVGEMWRHRYTEWSEKIHVIMNGFDPAEEIQPLPLRSAGPLLLSHVGDLYGGRRPDRLLSSLERLTSSGRFDHRRIRVQFVGAVEDGALAADKPPASKLMAQGCLECTGKRVAISEARRAMAQSHFLLVLDVNDAGVALQLPAKVCDYVRIGRPILAFTETDSPLERTLRRSGVRFQLVRRQDTDDEVDRKVLEFLEFPTDSVAASAWFQTQFDAKVQTQVLAGILDTVRGLKASAAIRA